MFYAQIDEDSMVVSVIDTVEIDDDPSYIPLDSYDTSIIGGKYDAETKTFAPPNPESFRLPEEKKSDLTVHYISPDNTEALNKLAEDNLTIMGAIADLYDAVTALQGGTTNG